jgi:Mce-associated membrane protein
VPSAPDRQDSDAAADDGTAERRRLSGRRLRRTAYGVAATLLLLTGGWFFRGAHQLRSAPSAENRALTDTEATTRVAGDVGNGLARVFSYTPDGLDATERSARSVLAGQAARKYTELLGRIRSDVAKQGVTLSSQAVRTGVIELHGDSARLLVFLDQVTRRGKDRPTAAAAQLTVTARWENDQWRIVEMRAR